MPVADKNRKFFTYFHLHLVSDATGETLNAISRASCGQFESVKPIEHVYALVRSERQLERALKAIEDSPGLVLYTIMNNALRIKLEERCKSLNIPCLSVLDPVLSKLGSYLGQEFSHKIGVQHELDAAYFERIEALNYTITHDDGQNTHELENAHVVLVGVSRTSKTPTCMYLAHRGIKAANVPVVLSAQMPHELEKLKAPLVIGLIASAERLIQIRRNRLLTLHADLETDYVDQESVRGEIIFARRMFEKNKWPTIDVTRRSIEETAAAILSLLTEQRGSTTLPTESYLPQRAVSER